MLARLVLQGGRRGNICTGRMQVAKSQVADARRRRRIRHAKTTTLLSQKSPLAALHVQPGSVPDQ